MVLKRKIFPTRVFYRIHSAFVNTKTSVFKYFLKYLPWFLQVLNGAFRIQIFSFNYFVQNFFFFLPRVLQINTRYVMNTTWRLDLLIIDAIFILFEYHLSRYCFCSRLNIYPNVFLNKACLLVIFSFYQSLKLLYYCLSNVLSFDTDLNSFYKNTVCIHFEKKKTYFWYFKHLEKISFARRKLRI